MTEKRLTQQLSNRLYELSEKSILQLHQMEPTGSINNVIVGIEKEVFGVMLKGDKKDDIDFHLCYVNGTSKLSGYALVLSYKLKIRNDLVLLFSKFLSQEYDEIDFVDTYNTYQYQIRTLFEKIGVFTYTEELMKKVKGNSAEMIAPHTKGIAFVPFLKKLDVLKNLFGEINIQILGSKNEKVYLMYNASNNFTKIGESKNPRYRERTLQAQEPDIHLIAIWEAPKKVEKHLHSKFQNRRERGEWFKLNLNNFMEIKDYMENINS